MIKTHVFCCDSYTVTLIHYREKLLESDLLSQENFDNLLVTPMRELTMGSFTEFPHNFEMPPCV